MDAGMYALDGQPKTGEEAFECGTGVAGPSYTESDGSAAPGDVMWRGL